MAGSSPAMTNGHVSMRAVVLLSALAMSMMLVPAPARADVAFKYVIDDSPLDVTPKPGEPVTEAVQEFKQTGKNRYDGKPEALAEGKTIYEENCASCHLPDGSGGMGAQLNGPTHLYPRVSNDVGLFEVIFGGASGAMQPFSQRLTQDQILKVMAYVRTLMKN
jgi:cytochrome c-L